jgi:hypothetical protein
MIHACPKTVLVFIFYFYKCLTLVESEPFVRAFSPGSTLQLRLKAFSRRGPKCSL